MRSDLFFNVLAGKWSLRAGRFRRAPDGCGEAGEFGCFQKIRTFGPWIGGVPGYSGVIEARLLFRGFEALRECGRGRGSRRCRRLTAGVAEAADREVLASKGIMQGRGMLAAGIEEDVAECMLL